MPSITVGLPFQIFEDHLRNNLPMRMARKFLDASSQNSVASFGHASTLISDSKAEKALRAVMPYDEDCNDSMKPTLVVPIYRSLLYSVANNFVGIDTLPRGEIIEFLHRETSESLYQIVRSAPEYYAIQAIALSIFKVSIDVRDARTVDFLLRHPSLGIQLNRSICSHEGQMCKPIEKAAALSYKDVVRTLLSHGADVSGALEYGRTWPEHRNTIRVRRIDPELFEMLVNAGDKIDWHDLRELIQDDHEGKWVCPMISKHAAKLHEEWRKGGIFIDVFMHQSHEVMGQILKIMLANSVDLNIPVERLSQFEPRTILDAVATRGNLLMMKNLFEIGALMTVDTLPFAISSGHEGMIEYLVQNGAKVDSMGSYGMTPLAAAIQLQKSSIINLVARHGGLNNMRKPELFRSALVAASEVGDAGWIQRLIENFCENRSQELGEALVAAIKGGHEKLALALIDAGADTNYDGAYIRRKDPLTCPLQEALQCRSAMLVHSLLEADADPNLVSKHGQPPIDLAVEWGDACVLQSIIKAGAKPKSKGQALDMAIERKDRITMDLLLRVSHSKVTKKSLVCAVQTGDVNIVSHILDHGADPCNSWAFAESLKQESGILELLLQAVAIRYPKGRGGWGSEVLQMAIESDDEELFKGMLESGADANSRLDQDFEHPKITVFAYAIVEAKNKNCKFVELLLQHKGGQMHTPETTVSVDYVEQPAGGPTKVRVTALLAAIGADYFPAIDLLLRHRADVNYPAKFGIKRTPLQKAVEVGNIEVVKLLLDRGANVNAPAAWSGGATALQLAAIKGHIPIARLLLEHGADMNAPTAKVNGRAVLEGAAEYGRLDMVAMLLKAGAGQNGKDKRQFKRAIELAEEHGYSYIADMLNHYLTNGKVRSGQFVGEEFLNMEMIEDDSD